MRLRPSGSSTAKVWAASDTLPLLISGSSRVRNGELSVSKWPGNENVADIGTKGVDGPTLAKHLLCFGFAQIEGRAQCAPELKHTAGMRR